MHNETPDQPNDVGYTNRFSRHPKLWICAIVATSFFAALVVTETILSRSAGDATYEIGRTPPDPPRFIRLREWQPNTVFVGPPPEIRRLNPGSSVKSSYRMAIDDDGFIGPTKLHTDPQVKIVFLGGSTTECMFVSEEKRFPYLAGRLLEARSGLRINSYNGGRSGNNVMHSIFALNAKVLPMHPDIVVLMHNANDQAVLAKFGTYWPRSAEAWNDFRRHLLQPKNDLAAALRTGRDLTVPHTYRALRRLFAQAGDIRLADRAHAATLAGSPSENASSHLAAETFRRALTQFVETAKIWGIHPVLMTQPLETRGTRRPERDDGGDYLAPERLARAGLTADSIESSQDQFNAVIRQVAASSDATLIDIAAASPWGRNELYDGLHFNDDGSERAAQIIALALQPVISDIQPPNRRNRNEQ